MFLKACGFFSSVAGTRRGGSKSNTYRSGHQQESPYSSTPSTAAEPVTEPLVQRELGNPFWHDHATPWPCNGFLLGGIQDRTQIPGQDLDVCSISRVDMKKHHLCMRRGTARGAWGQGRRSAVLGWCLGHIELSTLPWA